MKSRLVMLAVAMISGILQASGQGTFQNLNFENAVIIADPASGPGAYYADAALPGWTPTGFLGPNDVLYNSASLGSTSVSILDPNGHPPALDGSFSVYLYGGVTAASASISQTGVVPGSTQSLLFKAQQYGLGTLQVSLGGQNLSYVALSTGANYTLYGVNIPTYAGQSEQLTFSALEGANNAWNIDDIQFSVMGIPEPETWALLLCGAGALAALRRKRRVR